jgi:hypothetical protein
MENFGSSSASVRVASGRPPWIAALASRLNVSGMNRRRLPLSVICASQALKATGGARDSGAGPTSSLAVSHGAKASQPRSGGGETCQTKEAFMAEERTGTDPEVPEPELRRRVTLSDDLWQEITAFCRAEHIGSEAEAIHQLLQEALRARAQRRRSTARERSD